MTSRTFSRVEIKLDGKRDMLNAAVELRQLADQLEHVAGAHRVESDAIIIAQHKIGQTSKKLRAGL